jgi:hypothetical protein
MTSTFAATRALRLSLWLGVGLLCAGLVMLCARLAPGFVLTPRPAFAIAFTLVTVEILAVASFTPTLRGPLAWGAWVTALGALSLVNGARLTGDSAGLATAALLWTATGAGAALGGRIDKPGHLLAVAAVSGLSDLWSVYDPAGPSAVLARKVLEQPEQVTAFALSFPMFGSEHIPAIIGAGDALFAGLYAAAFERHALPRYKVLVALGVGFLLGLFLLLWLEQPVPLLPLLGGAVVASDARVRALPGKEGRSVLVVLAVLSVVLAVRVLR